MKLWSRSNLQRNQIIPIAPTALSLLQKAELASGIFS